MPGPIWKRPSAYVLLCAAVVISTFVARGDLRVDTDAGTKRARSDAAAPKVVRNHLPAPTREARRIVLAGRVLDALGFALEGAEILAAEGREVAATDGDGRFALAVDDAPYTDLSIRAAGHAPSLLRASAQAPGLLVVQLAPSAPWDPAEMAAPPAPALTGEGTVRDRDGRPVAGAYVTAAGSGLWSRTDDIGRYTLPLPDPQPTILVHRPATDGSAAVAARFGPLALDRARGIVPLPELVAGPGASIEGQLRDHEGSPLRGVPLAVDGAGMRHVCESDLDGRFRLDGLVAGVYEVRPLAWAGAIGRALEVALDGSTTRCELELEPAKPRRLQVCRENGDPVGNAYVAISIDGARRAVARADETGWAEVRVVDGPMHFEVRGEDGREQLAVRELDSEQARLVVAGP